MCKKIFKKPQKSDILIYDTYPRSLEEILKYHTYTTLHVRFEQINIYIYFKSLSRGIHGPKKMFINYIYTYIMEVQPKLIITYIDNKIDFYNISNSFPTIKTLFIQNGLRDNLDIFFCETQQGKNHKVDYMFVHNQYIGMEYKKRIEGKVIPIGSLLNNSFQKISKVKPGRIVYISTWGGENEMDSPYLIYLGNGSKLKVNWSVFYEAESIVLKFLTNWCNLNKKELTIVGRGNNEEFKYYTGLIPNYNFNFAQKKTEHTSYEIISTAEIVVSIDSTLGLESFSRGIKTAFFSIRKFDSFRSRRFGWPVNLPESGPFWTNRRNDSDFSEIMNFLNHCSQGDWDYLVAKFRPQLMDYDPYNSKLISTLNNLVYDKFIK
jgi:surface carbohydrate biosynthesis protein